MFYKFCKGWLPQWSLSKMLDELNDPSPRMWKVVVALIVLKQLSLSVSDFLLKIIMNIYL
jgi:hypothetical protein